MVGVCFRIRHVYSILYSFAAMDDGVGICVWYDVLYFDCVDDYEVSAGCVSNHEIVNLTV